MDGVLLTQLNTTPGGVPVKFTAAVNVLLHTTWSFTWPTVIVGSALSAELLTGRLTTCAFARIDFTVPGKNPGAVRVPPGTTALDSVDPAGKVPVLVNVVPIRPGALAPLVRLFFTGDFVETAGGVAIPAGKVPVLMNAALCK
jgi:hypothetical protein